MFLIFNLYYVNSLCVSVCGDGVGEVWGGVDWGVGRRRERGVTEGGEEIEIKGWEDRPTYH